MKSNNEQQSGKSIYAQQSGKSIYEQLGGTYSKVGDYYLPNMDIELPVVAGNRCSAQQESHADGCNPDSDAVGRDAGISWIGKYGLMRKTYLKEHRPVLYGELTRTGKLQEHLTEINNACSMQMDRMTAEMARRESVGERLKASNPMEWVARMNSIRHRAEEIVLREYVLA